MNPELAQFEALAKEILRRCMAEDDPGDIRHWLADTLNRMGGGDENAVMTWPESFDLVDTMLKQYEETAAMPEGERRLLSWPWSSWNNLIDPLEDGMLGVITAPDGQGKCLAKGTKVIMFDGSLKPVETLEVGDRLMGPDSRPRTIKALGHGWGPMYWVRQKRGLDYRVNDAHILALLQRDEHGNKKPVEMTVMEVLKKSPGYIQRVLQGYKVGLDFPSRDVPIDPYFLGLWLGDGNKRNGTILASDPEVIDWLKDYALATNCGITVLPDNERGSVMRVLISNGRGGLQARRGNTPAWKLSAMGLIENKHIPHEYMANSEDNRLRLLAGLIDNDGYYYASSKAYDITQKNEALARQIKYLADTLGFRTVISPKRATIKEIGYESTVWLVRIMGDVERIPVLIARKKAEPRKINKDWHVCGIEIEPSGEDEYFGFVLDGDGLFLLEDCTVTHNTIYAESISEYWAAHKNRVVFVHYELSRKLMMLRRTARHTSITTRDLKSGHLTQEQMQRIASVRPRLLAWDGCITYVHTPGWSMERTTAELEKLHNEGQCDVVVLDYLEKASASRRQLQMFGSNTYQREADNVEQLKIFSESTSVPVLMVAQMSKAGKQTGFDTVDRSGMRGAGEKSDKANLVVLLKRERIGEGYSNEVEVLVDKNTMGATGTFKQIMQPEFYRVGDIAKARL
jgi:replicative DNA helicase